MDTDEYRDFSPSGVSLLDGADSLDSSACAIGSALHLSRRHEQPHIQRAYARQIAHHAFIHSQAAAFGPTLGGDPARWSLTLTGGGSSGGGLIAASDTIPASSSPNENRRMQQQQHHQHKHQHTPRMRQSHSVSSRSVSPSMMADVLLDSSSFDAMPMQLQVAGSDIFMLGQPTPMSSPITTRLGGDYQQCSPSAAEAAAFLTFSPSPQPNNTIGKPNATECSDAPLRRHAVGDDLFLAASSYDILSSSATSLVVSVPPTPIAAADEVAIHIDENHDTSAVDAMKHLLNTVDDLPPALVSVTEGTESSTPKPFLPHSDSTLRQTPLQQHLLQFESVPALTDVNLAVDLSPSRSHSRRLQRHPHQQLPQPQPHRPHTAARQPAQSTNITMPPVNQVATAVVIPDSAAHCSLPFRTSVAAVVSPARKAVMAQRVTAPIATVTPHHSRKATVTTRVAVTMATPATNVTRAPTKDATVVSPPATSEPYACADDESSERSRVMRAAAEANAAVNGATAAVQLVSLNTSTPPHSSPSLAPPPSVPPLAPSRRSLRSAAIAAVAVVTASSARVTNDGDDDDKQDGSEGGEDDHDDDDPDYDSAGDGDGDGDDADGDADSVYPSPRAAHRSSSSSTTISTHAPSHPPPVIADRSNYTKHCPYDGCTASFPKDSTLARHIRCHTGEKPFVCPLSGCGAAFSEKGNLVRHSGSHADTRRFVCPFGGYCRARFRRAAHVEQHVAARHIARGEDVTRAYLYTQPPPEPDRKGRIKLKNRPGRSVKKKAQITPTHRRRKKRSTDADETGVDDDEDFVPRSSRHRASVVSPPVGQSTPPATQPPRLIPPAAASTNNAIQPMTIASTANTTIIADITGAHATNASGSSGENKRTRSQRVRSEPPVTPPVTGHEVPASSLALSDSHVSVPSPSTASRSSSSTSSPPLSYLQLARLAIQTSPDDPMSPISPIHKRRKRSNTQYDNHSPPVRRTREMTAMHHPIAMDQDESNSED